MITRLKGAVVEHGDASVVVDCGGVGYGVRVCNDEQPRLQIDSEATLYIAEQIKEDAHELFGFLEKSRRQLFDLLLGVSGVGPKAAMAILNIGTEGQMRSAIASGDVTFILAANGVGRKVAERVVVDLKNKVGLGDDPDATSFLAGAANSDEALQALVSLGHSAQDAAALLRDVDSKLETADRVRLALKQQGHSK